MAKQGGNGYDPDDYVVVQALGYAHLPEIAVERGTTFEATPEELGYMGGGAKRLSDVEADEWRNAQRAAGKKPPYGRKPSPDAAKRAGLVGPQRGVDGQATGSGTSAQAGAPPGVNTQQQPGPGQAGQ